ncbi:Fe(2+) transporter permease subunit FeoB [Coxiella endosymbiont of Rhipicephalus microplus]|uniref:Fe(2+) transporter permease subunit FeoB n=1 Tax=Coxiella endosymbiont of Rhipicephalus microplus TaxID=1656186 RepID=UPI000C80D14C|nr:Fe(2+) transporter permease subunit FeoB [Coxiella endosymbiont of Rhipicephalus microplus]PMB54661.1 Ferrous iron transport protein B [Coxiella-like endosymbiont]
MTKNFTVVLAGNPNCGKTVVFNALTGSSQGVGNWPGVTIDKKYGFFEHQGSRVKVVDLPGIYSTNVTSDAVDEKIACQYLLSNKANVIINVIDGSNLERNLYLTLQLLEMNIPVILAINMMDIVKQRGLNLDLKELSKLLDSLVVSLIAYQNQGINSLKDSILKLKNSPYTSKVCLPLPVEINKAAHLLTQVVSFDNSPLIRWLVLRLLEDDYLAKQMVNESVLKFAKQQIDFIKIKLNEEPDILIAEARYIFINQIAEQVTQLTRTSRQSVTQWIDAIVLNRFLGIPIFFGIMYLIFLFTINIGGAFQSFFDITTTTIFVDGLMHLLMSWHFSVWVSAIVASGVGKGINTTMTFVPIIGGMFLCLAFLEDSGYMARAAFVMDRFMRVLGLPGKSFIPMIVGFGCNVPGVMGARTLENQRDRVLTVVMIPFMSCGARLTIFSVFTSAFFPKGGATIIFICYLIGILIAILSGLVLRKTILPGKPAPLVMELPSYHIPQLNSLCRYIWQRLKNFLFRSGRYIIPICLIISVLNSITLTGKLVQDTKQQSLLSAIGRIITPVFAPLGVKNNNWPATVALSTGILVKEVVVGTLNTLYSEQGNHLSEQAHSEFNFGKGLRDAVISIPQNLSHLGNAFKNPILANERPHEMNTTAYGIMYKQFGGKAAAFSYLLFVLLYFPCVSTMTVMRREIGKRWTLFSILWGTGLSYVLAVICYQVLTVFNHPWTTLVWSASLLIALATVFIRLRACALYANNNDLFFP